LLGLVDAVVAGPYLQTSPSDLLWRSSGNQDLVPLSQLGRRRYAEALEATSGDRLQVIEADGRLTVVGLPRPGDLDRLAGLLAERGITLDQPSWSER
jgi:anaerobic ribonucleoside-triphosphate reductase activating protein